MPKGDKGDAYLSPIVSCVRCCGPDSSLGGGDWDGGGGRSGAKRRFQGTEAAPPDEPYSDGTLRSLENIDEAQLNYDLVRLALLLNTLKNSM